MAKNGDVGQNVQQKSKEKKKDGMTKTIKIINFWNMQTKILHTMQIKKF